MVEKNAFRPARPPESGAGGICMKRLILLRSLGVFFVFVSLFFVSTISAFASETNGTIDTTFKYAWGENMGWINFGCEECDVSITDSGIGGYAWSSQYGWINLNPTTSGITNDGEGTLSGSAWSSNLGWIDFSGVTINSSGEFLGYATVESDSSQINFNCINGNSCGSANFKIQTDWRPASGRQSGSSSGSRPNLVLPPPTITSPSNPIVSVINKIIDFFNPPKKPIDTIVEIPEIAPLAFSEKWNLLPVEAIRAFVFAPLPYEVRALAAKFPELDKTLRSVGIERLTDLSKLTGVTLNLPGLSELTNTLKGVGTKRLADLNKLNGVTLTIPGLSNIGTGKIALIEGLPLAKFSLTAKKNLPSEFVFARAGGELVDLNVGISIDEKGQVAQTISSLPGKTLKLVVKPISPAESVTGYFVFKSATPKITKGNTQIEISRSSLTASALLSMDGLVENLPVQTGNPEPIEAENKLVLSSFEYTDPDHDGIYTADVVSPIVPGEYEVITVINYIDPVLGTRQIRMITVIDPEGYVFEKNGEKETRIPKAIVSLYTLNNSTKKYELWSAKDYQQENPQITDVRGTYSFLVPEGSYYFQVEASGYNSYQGNVFVVTSGAGIHQNIELKSGWKKWLYGLDSTTILLIVVFLLLVYNLYRNRERDKLLKSFEQNGGQ